MFNQPTVTSALELAKQNFKNAIEAYENKNYEMAFFYFQLAAKENLKEAQNNLGTMYSEGLGIQQNIQEAAKLFHFAIHQNYEPAFYNLQRLFNSHPKDPVVIYYAAFSIGDQTIKNAFNLLAISNPKVFHELTKNDPWDRIQPLLIQENHAKVYQNRIFRYADIPEETHKFSCKLL